MALHFNLPNSERSIIKVIGVGGGGGNAVESMFHKGIKGVEFVVCNTDEQVLLNSPVPTRIQLGQKLTNGLGCGAKPEVGRQSALESIDDLSNLLQQNTEMVFVTAGMGGGTGTGAAPVIAALAREMGILTVAIVTTPFGFEGQWRTGIAAQGLEELRHCVDSLLVIDNNNLLKISSKNMKAKEAFITADSVVGNAARGIAEIITVKGMINVDMNDVRTIMKDSGTALMGMASFAGENRAEIAVEEALSSPLLNNADVHGAKGLLVNICASTDSLMMSEIETIMNYVTTQTGSEAKCIFGVVEDDTMGDELRVTVIATGFDDRPAHYRPELDVNQNRNTQNRNYGSNTLGGNSTHRNQQYNNSVAFETPRHHNPRQQPTLPTQPANPAVPRRRNQQPDHQYNQPNLFNSTQGMNPQAGQVPPAQNTPLHPEPQQEANYNTPYNPYPAYPQPELENYGYEEDYANPVHEQPITKQPEVTPQRQLQNRIQQQNSQQPDPRTEQLNARADVLSTRMKDYDFRDPRRLRELEEEPAWKRKMISIEEDAYDTPRSPSRLSIDTATHNKMPQQHTLRTNNAFLYDNVD